MWALESTKCLSSAKACQELWSCAGRIRASRDCYCRCSRCCRWTSSSRTWHIPCRYPSDPQGTCSPRSLSTERPSPSWISDGRNVPGNVHAWSSPIWSGIRRCGRWDRTIGLFGGLCLRYGRRRATVGSSASPRTAGPLLFGPFSCGSPWTGLCSRLVRTRVWIGRGWRRLRWWRRTVRKPIPGKII